MLCGQPQQALRNNLYSVPVSVYLSHEARCMLGALADPTRQVSGDRFSLSFIEAYVGMLGLTML